MIHVVITPFDDEYNQYTRTIDMETHPHDTGYHVDRQMPEFKHSRYTPDNDAVRIVLLEGALDCQMWSRVTNISLIQRIADMSEFTITDLNDFEAFKRLVGVDIPWHRVAMYGLSAAEEVRGFPPPDTTPKPTFIQYGRFKRRIAE